ncbi:hypothetical protein ACMU_04640 [Actibacterium mucosum KCTC 23349]|uniref:Major facilitator superfamily (MFS) profile domain-containing protein n=1 Tax=Actibacterium mucosum KCTC 23349 TaxID=1454373 RepID=A0A037ZEQ2_9RHOB|nr:MFS transporter [Actibacterium mucosum]KAJ53996.1 hypothetical protein ACMU_04640 [Actibacterium mucosum KCTC 23349]
MPSPPLWREPAAAALILCAALITMANSTISPALPGIEALYPNNPNAAMLTRLLVPAPSITAMAIAPFVGALADRFGRRPLLLGGLALYVVAGAAPLWPMSLEAIFVSRLVLGVAVALVLTTSAALVGDLFLGERRAGVLGLQISARNFGGMLGIVGAGMLASISTRLPFGIYISALLVLWITWRAVQDVPRVESKNTSTQEETRGWAVPLAAICALQMVTAMTFFIMPTQMPFYVQSLGHPPASSTGITMGTLTLAGALAALRYRALAGLLGSQRVLALGYGAMAIGFAILAPATGLLILTAGAAMVGVGFALVSPALPALALATAPDHRRGLALGALTTAVYLGQILSPFASQALIEGYGFAALYVTATVAAGALAVGAVLRRTSLD